MSRTKGQTGPLVLQREQDENRVFSLKRMDQDLRLAELRIQQAITREGRLTELLSPALDLLEETRVRLSKI